MRDRRWAYYLLVSCALGVAGIFLGPTFRRVLTEVVGVAGVLLTWQRSRTLTGRDRRPWQALSLAGACFLVGGLVRAIHGLVSGVASPYPSPADLFYFLSYGLLIATVFLLVRLRSDYRKDSAVTLDAVIVAAAAAVAEWAIFLAPYLRDTSIPLDQRALSSVYSLVTIVLVASTIRLAVGPGFRSVSFWLLTSGMGLLFVADLCSNLATAGRVSPDVPQCLAPFIFAFWASAALHPDSSRLTEAPDVPGPSMSLQRLSLLAIALLVVPAITIWELQRPDGIDFPVVLGGWVLLALLVLLRLADLVRAKERAAETEGVLRHANALLATARSRNEMNEGALETIRELAGDVRGFSAQVGLMRPDGMQIVHAIGEGADQQLGVVTPTADLPWPLRLALAPADAEPGDDTRSYLLEPATNLKASDVNHCLIAPLVSQAKVRGAIILNTRDAISPPVRSAIEQLTSTVSLALESATLTEDLHREQSERRFRALVENSSDIVVVADLSGTLIFASPACRHILGVDEEEVVGMRAVDLVHPDDAGLAADVLAKAGGGHGHGHLAPVEVRIVHADGDYRWFEIRARDLSFDPEVGGMVINAREITERKEAEQEVARREARFRALVQHSSDIVAVLDLFGTITYVSPAVTEALGYEPEELINVPVLDLLDLDERNLVARHSRDLGRASRTTGSFATSSLEVQVRHKDGSLRCLDTTVTDLRREDAVGGVVLNARDVTVRKALVHDLRHQALHDSLTGLGNRAMFLHHVGEALTRSRGDQVVATLFIDLDDFKTVNDSLGHAVGDELLVLVAERVSTCLHHADVAARLGGDEFAVLVESPWGRDEVTKLADRLLTALRSPFVVQHRDFSLAASIGIAFGEEDSTAELLLRNADMAMYLAKEKGKDRYEVFQEDMHATVFERLVLKADLAHGIESGQLRLCYQPIVSLQTGRITGVEALVRWDHPTRGPLGPAQFVSLAEDTGLIVPLGHWVLEEACRQLRSWQLRLPSNASLTMSVNLSVRQLESDEIIEDISRTIGQYQLDPSTITMELTESMLMADTEISRRRLRELKTIGVSLAIDDFGTGYSSLGYVQQYPIDIIKIDRSFVMDLSPTSGTGANTVVVQTMIEMAQRLGVHIVAEGIEAPDQLRVLQALGCDLGQGYFFSRPVEAHQIGPLLTSSIEDGRHFLEHGGGGASTGAGGATTA